MAPHGAQVAADGQQRAVVAQAHGAQDTGCQQALCGNVVELAPA
jgi:hypothetical protein